MNNLLNLASADFSAAVVIFNLLLAFVLSLFIAWVYVKTHKGLSYSQSFVFSIVIVAVVTATIIMTIQSSIVAALGLLGVFSFIRFRTILKETKDVVFIFIALAIGLAVGINSYVIALIAVLMLSAIIFALTKFNFASGVNNRFILNLVSQGLLDEARLRDTFSSHVRSYNILHTRRLSAGDYEYTISVEARNGVNPIIQNVDGQGYIKKLDIITGKDTVEY